MRNSRLLTLLILVLLLTLNSTFTFSDTIDISNYQNPSLVGRYVENTGSIYHQPLNSLLSVYAKPRIPKTIEKILVILVVILVCALIAIWLGQKIIKRQKRAILEQNRKLKKLVHHISELRNIPTMDELFEKLVEQLQDIFDTNSIQVASLIEHDDGIRLDSAPFVTKDLKPYAEKYVSQAPFSHFDLEGFINFKLSDDRIRFGNNCVAVKFDSSYNLNGYLYIGLTEPAKDREFIEIYLSDIMTNLQKIIVNIKSLEEKTKLFISLGELIEKRDHEVSHHVRRVSEATGLLASACGYTDDELSNIIIASSVHDIGKIFVPDQILNKPSKLTDEEFEIIKSHTTNELKIMADAGESLSKSVHDIVRYHHENWDGSGYPEGLKKEEIPLGARIVSIIDVFEALTHDRPYKKAWAYEDAVAFIQNNKGIKFDPHLVDVFMEISKDIEAVFDKYNS